METFLLHDLATGQTTELPDHPINLRSLAARPLILRPDESLTHLIQITDTWLTEFPGDSPALAALRHNLIRAHWNLLRAQSTSEEGSLHAQLDPAALDLPLRLQYLNRQSAHADRLFNLSLQNLRALRKDTIALELAQLRLQALQRPAPNNSKSAPSRPPSEPVAVSEPAASTRLPAFHQGVNVLINEDRTMKIEVGPPNSEMLELAHRLRLENRGDFDGNDFCRTILFENGIPERCRWHFISDLDWDKAWQYVSLTYTVDEYIALAEYEDLHKPDYLLPLAPSDAAKIRTRWHPLTYPPEPGSYEGPEIDESELAT